MRSLYEVVAGRRSERSWLSEVNTKFTVESNEEDGVDEELETRELMALTASIGGLQMVWLTIFSHGSAYLSSLDIPKLHISLIWALAPICGATAPPIVGVLSDRCRLPSGRRRPFMISGAGIVIAAITALAWITPITDLICSIHGVPSMAGSLVLYWAIFWVVVLNIGIQILQSASRALILDVCPSQQQALASAWAGRFTGVGNILGYMLGSVPLPLLGGGLEAWRFRWMAACAVVALSATVTVTAFYIHEQPPQVPTCDEGDNETVVSPIIRTFRAVVQGVVSMPPKAAQVCKVQFFSAMGWFGFLFYNSTYVSDLYLHYMGDEGMVHGPAHRDVGMRFATTASVLFAVLALAMNMILPYIVSSSYELPITHNQKSWIHRLHFFRQTHILWALGSLLYATLTLSTIFVTSSTGGTITVALAGIAWGITQWAPFALIGEEIAAQQADQDSLIEQGGKAAAGAGANQSGAMLGVHSTAVCAPQILAAVASSAVFWVTAWMGIGDAVGWVLRLSGVAGVVAAWLAWRL
ncbi:MFS general substrate transporter [Lentithecium fluviatile CBS 122367]|uniref:MFS general substrate transporter n=1 Tax=Lentithecium fluviatile CBS 122367 TaxID=1168545 RepID=A0A6G1IP83_9PLEO|nr:MFS general substrate transporter [Lentithecium fluviatile CBS 122367]